MPRNTRLLPIVAVLLIALPALAIAGGKATFEISGQADATTTLTWQDAETLRMQSGAQPGYILLRDGKAYSVTNVGGTPRVMALQGMMKMMQGMGKQAGHTPAAPDFGHIDSVETTGDSETVAGIDGHVYQMHWTDADGSKKSGKAVLTGDPLAVEMTHAYLGSVAAMSDSESQTNFQKSLPSGQQGLLRLGDTFRVQSIERADPPASTFELPAKPMDLQQMMGGMGDHR